MSFAAIAVRTGVAATDVRVDFTLNTTDRYGAPLQEKRYYYIYRPDNLPSNIPVPMILVFEASANGGPASFFHRKADQAGFLVVSCSFSGNSTGTPGSVWSSENPLINGNEDYDYVNEVIDRVRASDNGGDAFTAGLSKGGHMSLAYACERPNTIRAAVSVDEFMQLISNIPKAPVPTLVFHGTLDTNVPYTMTKDTVDAWRAANGLLNATAVTTYESSALQPGMVSQATWRDAGTGLQTAFVTIIGGTHTYPLPGTQTGYDCTDGMWAFFSQFLSAAQGPPRIASQPVNNVQLSGQPATFWVTATGVRPLRYQWQKGGVDIPGATANWHTIPEVSATDSGIEYRAVVTNDLGSATSSAASVTVKAAPADPSITVQPADRQTVAGQPIMFQVTAAGTPPLRYQWRKNGIDLAGATGNSLALSANTADSGAAFSVQVTNGVGASVISSRASLNTAAASGAPIVLTNPVRPRVLAGATATWSVSAWSATPMTYQWQKGSFNGNMADIPGATSATYTTPPTTLADHLTLYRCVISNDAGAVTSPSEMLFVTATPVAPSQISSDPSAVAQTGVPFRYAIVATGGTIPLSYSAAPLPAGLSVDAGSGVISGTPTEAGTTGIAIQVSNAAGKIAAILNLTVGDAPAAVSLEAWRLAHFGASVGNPAVAGDAADPDGDGYSNLDEFYFGSDPLNAASVPTALSATVASLDFGPVAAGESEQALLTIRNSGGSTVTGTATAAGEGFVVDAGGSFTLPPNSSARVFVSFTPARTGTFSGAIAFTSNGGAASVNVAGIGAGPREDFPFESRGANAFAAQGARRK